MGFSDNFVSAALQDHFKALIHLELEMLPAQSFEVRLTNILTLGFISVVEF